MRFQSELSTHITEVVSIIKTFSRHVSYNALVGMLLQASITIQLTMEESTGLGSLKKASIHLYFVNSRQQSPNPHVIYHIC